MGRWVDADRKGKVKIKMQRGKVNEKRAKKEVLLAVA
jgi:hypothetical protein